MIILSDFTGKNKVLELHLAMQRCYIKKKIISALLILFHKYVRNKYNSYILHL